MRPALGIPLLLALAVSAPGQEKTTLQPVRSWTGRVSEADKEGLIKEAPTTGYVVDQAALDKLWRAWRGDEKSPMVDFRREAVFVNTVKGPNQLKVAYRVDGAGDLKTMAEATAVAGPGFSYVVDVLPRAAFKTFRGKALPRPE